MIKREKNINNFNGFMNQELNCFLKSWEESYSQEAKKLDLFNINLTKHWSYQQKIHFAKVFYHCRGHFHEFLWFMGNHAPDSETKLLILHNIAEEFSVNGRSHELLYQDFAESLGADLQDEFIKRESYLPFVRSFNEDHLEWLRTHTWEGCLAAFSAYEKLDNIDYENLYSLAENFELKKRNLVFFNVHRSVEHFDSTIASIEEIWRKYPETVKEAFTFIGNHQIKMWKNLSEKIFSSNN